MTNDTYQYRAAIEKVAMVLYTSVEPVEPKRNLKVKPAWHALGLPLRSAFRKAALDLLDEPLPLSSIQEAAGYKLVPTSEPGGLGQGH